MNENNAIQIFEGKEVRIAWDVEKEKYYFAVADIVEILTESKDVKQYVKRMRARDPELNSKWGTICTPVLPRLHASIDNDERLTPEQKKLVLLVRLRFKNNEISNLLSLTPQMVTNRIALLNKRLYGRDSAKGFYENLSNYLPLCT